MPDSARSSAVLPVWHLFAALSLLWGAGLWIGISMLLAVSISEAAWAVTLAALIALGGGWLRAARYQLPTQSPVTQSSVTVGLGFMTHWTLWLAKLLATAAVALSLAGYLLKLQPVDAAWLLPVAMAAIWAAALSQNPKIQSPAIQYSQRSNRLIWILALCSSLGLVGLILAEGGQIALMLGSPVADFVAQPLPQAVSQNSPQAISLAPQLIPQLPRAGLSAVESPLRLAELLRMTALLSVTFAGFDSLSLSQRLRPTLSRKLLSIAITLGWLLYFGLVIIRRLQPTDGFSLSEPNLLSPALQLLRLTPLLSLSLSAAAIAALAGALWLQIPRLDWHLRSLELGCHAQWPSFRLMQLGLGVLLSGLVLVGDVETLWSFSAFAALIHRALCHWQIGHWQIGRLGCNPVPVTVPEPAVVNPQRYLHGLAGASSLILAFWLEWQVWLVSLGLIALGLVWRGMRQWSDGQSDLQE